MFAEPDQTILSVAEQMAAEGVRHIPIVDRGTTVGVVSARDVLPILTSHARSTI